MGNCCSSKRIPEDCFICWEPVDSRPLILCTHCNIHMHGHCQEMYRIKSQHNYCKCPHCQQIGTLGIKLSCYQLLICLY